MPKPKASESKPVENPVPANDEKDLLIADQKNRLLRALADFDNFKKRAAVEQEQIIKFSNEKLILELLPVVDGLDRAITSSNGNEDVVKGLALIHRQMLDVLNKFGVVEIEALGKAFDPHLHEAILKQESDKKENTIIEVAQKGYTLFGKTIRPSMVIVSGK